MIEELLYLLATVVASCIVMMLHEIPKTFAYKRAGKKKYNLVNPLLYIDPVGLIFSVIGFCGFSRPYMYHVKDKKTNLAIGYTGLISLFFLFVLSLLGCKFVLGPAAASLEGAGMIEWIVNFIFWTVQYMSVVSLGMLFTNLFPIVPFDMGNLIAGYSTDKFLAVLRNDYNTKMVFFITMILGVIKAFSVQIFLFLYNL